jgi:hypothetical protein
VINLTGHTNLILHQGALGDWAIILPILRSLTTPTHPTVFACPWSRATLAAQLIQHVLPANIESSTFIRLHDSDALTRLTPAEMQWFRNLHKIVCFISSGSDLWSTHIRILAPNAQIAYIESRIPPEWKSHILDWHQQQLIKQGFDLPPHNPTAVTHPQGPIVIHPGSGSPTKCWPTQNFESLIESLRSTHANIRVLLGEVEIETWSPALLHRWIEKYQAQPIHSLQDLHRSLSDARVFIGHDSGPTHLTAQLGLPTIALFGPTNPTLWAPHGPQVTILAPPTPREITWLDVDTVLRSVQSHL